MKLSIRDVINSKSALVTLNMIKLPANVSMRIGIHSGKPIDDALRELEKARRQLIDEYGERDTDDNIVVKVHDNGTETTPIDKTKRKQFNEAYDKLLDETIEFEPHIVKLNELKKTIYDDKGKKLREEYIDMPSAVFSDVHWLFEE